MSKKPVKLAKPSTTSAPVAAQAPAPKPPKAKPIDVTTVAWADIARKLVEGESGLRRDLDDAHVSFEASIRDLTKKMLEKVADTCKGIGVAMTVTLWDVHLHGPVKAAYAALSNDTGKVDTNVSNLKTAVLALTNGCEVPTDTKSLHTFVTKYARPFLQTPAILKATGVKAKTAPDADSAAAKKKEAEKKREAARRQKEALTVVANAVTSGENATDEDTIQLRMTIVETIRENWDALQADLVRLLETKKLIQVE